MIKRRTNQQVTESYENKDFTGGYGFFGFFIYLHTAKFLRSLLAMAATPWMFFHMESPYRFHIGLTLWAFGWLTLGSVLNQYRNFKLKK